MNARVKQLVTHCLLLIVLAASSTANAKTILVFGDSFSTGFGLEPELSWVDSLREITCEPYSVINASQNGRYLTNSHAALHTALLEHQPDIVLIALGVNDGNQRIKLSKIRQALQSMIETVRISGTEVAVLSTSLPFSEGDIYALDYENVFISVTDSFNVPHLPMVEQTFFSSQLNLQADKWHPSQYGQVKIVERTRRFLIRTYGLAFVD